MYTPLRQAQIGSRRPRPIYWQRLEWSHLRPTWCEGSTVRTGQLVGIESSVNYRHVPKITRDPLAVRDLDGKILFIGLLSLLNFDEIVTGITEAAGRAYSSSKQGNNTAKVRT